MKELDIDMARIHAADRDSARGLEMTVGGYANPVLAGVVIAGFFLTVAYVLTGQAQVESALAGALVGYVSAKAEQVIAYYFGSSSGSKKKTAIMGKAFERERQGEAIAKGRPPRHGEPLAEKLLGIDQAVQRIVVIIPPASATPVMSPGEKVRMHGI